LRNGKKLIVLGRYQT